MTRPNLKLRPKWTIDKVMKQDISHLLYSSLLCLLAIVVSQQMAYGLPLFQVSQIKKNDDRLIATSPSNFAISSPKLGSKNWQTVSLNGDEVFVVTIDGQKQILTRSQLGPAEVAFIESLRDEISNSYTVAGGGLGGTYSIMSSTGSGTSSSYSSSSSSTSGGTSMTSMSSGGGGPVHSGMSFSIGGDDNFSISKSDMPFDWYQVQVSGGIVSLIYNSGKVTMQPTASLEPQQLELINKLRDEAKAAQSVQSKMLVNTMQSSLGTVSNLFNSILSRLPKPPNYRDVVGDMFGNNFPFGPNNSPFEALSRGSGAIASAGAG